jgi:hypothetical protein
MSLIGIDTALRSFGSVREKYVIMVMLTTCIKLKPLHAGLADARWSHEQLSARATCKLASPTRKTKMKEARWEFRLFGFGVTSIYDERSVPGKRSLNAGKH